LSNNPSVLLLWDGAVKGAATVKTHVDALVRESSCAVYPLSMFGSLPDYIDLDKFDVIVVHYSLFLYSNAYVNAESRQRLRKSRALKAVFIQDEYRFVDQSVRAMRESGIGLLYTCVPEAEIQKVYPESSLPGVKKVNVLTGYVDDALLGRDLPSYSERNIDIGYRARKVPAWLGELGQEKWRIGRRVSDDAPQYGLTIDVAYREEERLYGEEWVRFLSNCKATLGVESGASVFDFSGDIQAKVEKAALENPELDFFELQRRYFFDLEGKIILNQISPRCFEAAALKTLMILYEGRYSDRLIPWRHYLPLKKDHSNFSEIVSILKDESRVTAIVDCAYQEVALSPKNSFKEFVRIFDDSVFQQLGSSCVVVPDSYSREEFLSIAMRHEESMLKAGRFRSLAVWAYFLFFGKILGSTSEAFRDRVQFYLSKYMRNLFRKLFGR